MKWFPIKFVRWISDSVMIKKKNSKVSNWKCLSDYDIKFVRWITDSKMIELKKVIMDFMVMQEKLWKLQFMNLYTGRPDIIWNDLNGY